jgi:hypothetical protein
MTFSRVLRLIVVVIPLTIALPPSAAVAMEVSLACLFQVMTGVQQLMTLCGEPLDHSTEMKYQELSTALKKYINENALRDEHKIGSDYDERSLARAREQLRVREGFCKRPEYKYSRLTYCNSCKASKRWTRSANDLILPPTHGKGDAFDGRCSGGARNIAGDDEYATATSLLLPLAHPERHGVGAFADGLPRGRGSQTQVSLWAVCNKACTLGPKRFPAAPLSPNSSATL